MPIAEAELANKLLALSGASELLASEEIQALWSGYGSIRRFQFRGTATETNARHSLIVKQVRLPAPDSKTLNQHPRGWATSRSHQRKLQSYRVESAWYRDYATRCDASCRVPACLWLDACEAGFTMVLEDLDAAGFAERKQPLPSQHHLDSSVAASAGTFASGAAENTVGRAHINACLAWLASFHAGFLGVDPVGLWPVGSYWHLATRPDELAALTDRQLAAAAPAIDQKLSATKYPTLIHGDAKLANFCFALHDDQVDSATAVAAVDFQYVGAGCGMKDVAYFIGSCLSAEHCQRYEAELLDYYFACLVRQLKIKQPAVDGDAVARDWRSLYAYAVADFQRFLEGWSPGHWKSNDYAKQITAQVVRDVS